MEKMKPHSGDHQHEFWKGVQATLPILLGAAPLGTIYGVLATSAGLSSSSAQAASAIIFAGSSQFILVQLINLGTPALIMILTGFIINLRHALYSISIAPYFSHLSTFWKLLLSYLLTDETYAIAVMDFHKEDQTDRTHWFFLGAGLALWSCWQLSTAAGIYLGAQIPPGWGLDFTLALTFIALSVPAINDRPTLLTAISAGTTALLTSGLPYKLGLIAAAGVGIAVGYWSEQRQ